MQMQRVPDYKNPYQTEARRGSRSSYRLYEHTEREATGLAFNDYPKLLLLQISLRRLPVSSAAEFILTRSLPINTCTVKSKNGHTTRLPPPKSFCRRYFKSYRVSPVVYVTAYEYFLLLRDGAQDVAVRNGAL